MALRVLCSWFDCPFALRIASSAYVVRSTMDPYVRVTGKVAPLDRANVDTDQIIPAVHLKRVERTGFGQFLFEAWRKLPDGKPNPDFVLNNPKYREATVLVAGPNFGR